MKSITEILKELREKKGKTQQDLANVLNLEVSSYGKKELGKADITLTQLERISNFYNISVLELLAYPNTVSINEKQNIKGTLSIEINGEKQDFEINLKQ
ncbi:MAG: helix-turn-helix domain-containing protein [Bacteroidales bacterium]|jgi:transcriptional regulator with XRE-family HTH domain|nr:helix-turn-helix domain-containing protein [Bacteroidales bacterium]